VQELPKISGCARWDNVDSMGAFRLLEKSQCFRLYPVGVAAAVPPEEIALCRLMKQDDASAVLEKLYLKTSSAGRLYALLGLRFVDRTKYEKLLPEMKNDLHEVDTQGGCIVYKEPVQMIIESMEAGNYDAEIQRNLKSD
jgi:hypothetical protein